MYIPIINPKFLILSTRFLVSLIVSVIVSSRKIRVYATYFFLKRNTYMIERDIFLKGKRERLDTEKKGHMTKDRMLIRHQLRWWIEWCRIWFFSTRFGRCRSCSPTCLHESIFLFFSLFFSSPLKSVQWWGMACVRCSPQENFVSHSWLALAISHAPSPFLL